MNVPTISDSHHWPCSSRVAANLQPQQLGGVNMLGFSAVVSYISMIVDCDRISTTGSLSLSVWLLLVITIRSTVDPFQAFSCAVHPHQCPRKHRFWSHCPHNPSSILIILQVSWPQCLLRAQIPVARSCCLYTSYTTHTIAYAHIHIYSVHIHTYKHIYTYAYTP